MVKKRRTKPTENLDISSHVLVPKHEKCPETERKAMLKNYGIETKDLPKISINDPAVYNLGLEPGDVVKITRDSPTAGKSVFYRVVIEIK